MTTDLLGPAAECDKLPRMSLGGKVARSDRVTVTRHVCEVVSERVGRPALSMDGISLWLELWTE